MSTLKVKKAELLAKIAIQKAKQKEQLFTIPTIKLLAKDKQQKNKNKSIPNTKVLDIHAISDDKMREFMKEVYDLDNTDFELPSGGVYTNPIILNGYKLFIKSYVNDQEKEWLSIPLFSKKIWLLKGYVIMKGVEWDKKKFIEDIEIIANSNDILNDIISSYLKGNVKYGKFIEYWKSTRDDKKIKQDIKDQLVQYDNEKDEETNYVRLPITDEEKVVINDLNQKITGYKDALSGLDNNFMKRREDLSELSHTELVNIVKPIISKKTKEQLVDTILNAEYVQLERDGYKDITTDSEYEERNIRKIKLDEMSYTDLVLNASVNKTSPKLIDLLLQDEFYVSRKKLVNKIFKLEIKINNLSLGKYVDKNNNVKSLTEKELLYRNSIILHIRLLDLQTKSYNQLVLHASSIGAMKNFKLSENETNLEAEKRLSYKLINKILSKEFPEYGYNISDKLKIPIVTSGEMKNVLMTLDEDKIHILAFSDGMKHPEKRGKYYNIDFLIKKKFPYKKGKNIKHLVLGKFKRNWSYHKRRSELEGLTTLDLNTIALTLGLDLRKGVKNEQLINSILDHEENLSKLIPREESDKQPLIDKISQITGISASKYKLWSLEDLQQRLEELKEENHEYWVEIETERLYNKLSQIVNITQPKYKNAKKWSVKKLRRYLNKNAGSNWENYKPLIEDYSFVKCIGNLVNYEWIEGKVTGVWLSGPNGDMPKKEYIFKDVSIEEDGHLWYQANKKFFNLQCNMYKKDRVQNGDVLTSYTQTGEKIDFMIGFTISGYQHEKGKYKSRTHMVKTTDGRMVQRTFIIQDESIFNKEKEFMRRSMQLQNSRVQDILDSTVSERTADNVMKSLSRSLLDIAPMKSDYGIIKINSSGLKSVDYNTPYMQILMATLRDNPEQTNKDLFTKAASLLVFLNMPESSTFKNNVYNEYYLPDILATLSPSEKFPEAFQDPNVSGKFLDEVTADINNKIFKIIKDFATNEYQSQDPTKRKMIDPTSISIFRSIKTSKRLNACENKSRVKGSPDEEIVYYNENGKIYCFTVDELYNQMLIEENLNNPETGKPFDMAFVKRFDELYNKRLSDDGLLTGYFQKKYGFNMEELVKNKQNKDTIKSEQPVIAENIWKIVGKDLAELEDQLSNEKPSEGDEIDEEREEERRDVEVKEGTRETREIDQTDVCEYCNNHLSDDSIKSVILHGDESRIIKFCSFKCFEDKNDWNKFKIKIQKTKNKQTDKIKKKANKLFIENQKNKNLVLKDDKWVAKSPTPVKLSRDEIKRRKKLIKKQVKEGAAAFDKIAFPLMSKEELREVAKEKGIKIPGGLDKMGTASFLYKILHPKSTKGILKEKTAKKEILKIENKKEKKKKQDK